MEQCITSQFHTHDFNNQTASSTGVMTIHNMGQLCDVTRFVANVRPYYP